MEINYFKFSSFIKRKLNIKLFPYQEVILKAFCEGQEVRTTRAIVK